MSIAFFLVMALVVGAPALVFLYGPLTWGGLAIVSSVSLAITSLRMPPGEAAHFIKVARPAILLAAIPILWIVIQLLPAGPLAHPIWQSAAAALSESWLGRISVDPGATWLALGHLLTAIAIGFATMALTIDRGRAELCLQTLTALTGIMALTIIVHDIGGFTFLGEVGLGIRASFDGAAALGLVLALASADLAIERFETRRQAGMTWARLIERLALSFETFLACLAAITFFQADFVWIAALAGAAAFGLLVLIRRFDVGPWVGFGVAAVAAVVLILVIVDHTGKSEVTLQFATHSTQVAMRMLDDAPWAGTGAGTYTAVTALYGDASGSSSAAPTTAATLSVELGRPFVWLGGCLAVVLAGLLLRGALARGRDSFYAAAAGACVLVLLLQALRDTSLLAPSMTILASVIVGLGFGQSVSRRLEQS